MLEVFSACSPWYCTQYKSVCMYICTYVCMYVCTYVCVYVCMYVCLYVCTYMYVHVCVSVQLTILHAIAITDCTPDADFITKKTVRVKLSGDGTNIGKRLHVVNFGFTILDEGDRAYSAAGNHCIAIFKEPENYTSLKNALKDVSTEVESLSSIVVNDTTFAIEYYLGGDWKFLAVVTGIDSASSKYACIWCKCPALERHNSEEKWSILDPAHGARSIEENIRSSLSKSFNVSHPPLFPTIPLTRVVVDNLHVLTSSRHARRPADRVTSYPG